MGAIGAQHWLYKRTVGGLRSFSSHAGRSSVALCPQVAFPSRLTNLCPLYLFSFHELDSLRPRDLDALFPLTPLLEMREVLCTPDVPPVTMHK